jgi:hypothetical protein
MKYEFYHINISGILELILKKLNKSQYEIYLKMTQENCSIQR